MPRSTRQTMFRWLNRALGVVALWFASQHLGDAFGGVDLPATAIKGGVWVLIAMVLLAQDLWVLVRPRRG